MAENLYSQIDKQGRSHAILYEIIEHQFDKDLYKCEILRRAKQNELDNNKHLPPYQTTKDCGLLMMLKGSNMECADHKDAKEAFLVQVTKYAKFNAINNCDMFSWWVPYVLQKRNRITSKVKSKYWKGSHKFGIIIPKTVEKSLRFDAEEGTNFWSKAIAKEMNNVRVAFEFNDTDTIPTAHKRLHLHLIFDIKLGSLERKA